MRRGIHPAAVTPCIQCAVAIVGAIVGLIGHSMLVAVSLLAGGLIAAVPQALFGWWVYRERGARRARKIAHNLFIGEGLKLSLSAILLASAWSYTDGLLAEAVLAGFVISILAGQLSLPLIMNGRPLS